MRIAVIGGTFNPPTNAHIKLARTAYKVLMADLVLLVPARQDYMRQWKNYQSSDILSDALRMDMLHAIEADWLKIETCEMDGAVSGSSFDTLNFIREKYQTDDIFFVVGSDKLEEIPRWSHSHELLRQNRFLVLRRNEDNVEQMILSNKFLHGRRKAFMCYTADDESNTISSTEIRNMLAAKTDPEKIRKLVPDEVFKLLMPHIT